MQPIDALYIALATYAVSYMVTQTSGPSDIFARLREWTPALRGALSCFYCLAVWVAVALFLIYPAEIGRAVVLLFAITGAAYFVNRISD